MIPADSNLQKSALAISSFLDQGSRTLQKLGVAAGVDVRQFISEKNESGICCEKHGCGSGMF
jgi:hypothetical protein